MTTGSRFARMHSYCRSSHKDGKLTIMAALGAAARLNSMHPRLTALKHIDELDTLIAQSGNRPVVLFKHSYTCGISAEALDELVSHLDSPADAHYAMVTVQTHRDISNAVTAKLGVRHETPQAILVRDGQVAWTASHFRVNASELSKALTPKAS